MFDMNSFSYFVKLNLKKYKLARIIISPNPLTNDPHRFHWSTCGSLSPLSLIFLNLQLLLKASMANSSPDYKKLFLEEQERRKQAEERQKQAEDSQKQAEESRKQEEESRKQAEDERDWIESATVQQLSRNSSNFATTYYRDR
ncbi:hypothetical protein VN97_g8229 [Penicillium thymicola]|uniref:Uncharacterized protein n=1 Tax=Penicillium thymicola TaxID=293382 RepID=A0AAI9TE44_PENTH|nr:hypothetical protein VN97_g8229 [Penicillium thymicola]